MSTFRLKILTQENTIYDAEVASLLVMCENGQLAVLPRHAPMAAILAEGPVIIRAGAKALKGAAGRGMLHVGKTETAVLVDSFRWEAE